MSCYGQENYFLSQLASQRNFSSDIKYVKLSQNKIWIFWSVPSPVTITFIYLSIPLIAPNNHDRRKSISALSSCLSFFQERIPIIYVTRASQTKPQCFLGHNMLTKCFQTSVKCSFQVERAIFFSRIQIFNYHSRQRILENEFQFKGKLAHNYCSVS